MSYDEIIIRVEALSKRYEMYSQPVDRLKQMILPKFQRIGRLQTREYFKEFWALRDVSFEVCCGETVGIIGRNGSGKSTLLQLICGTLHPTSGNVIVNGRIAALLELGAGFNIEFTGRENVFLSGLLYGFSEQDLRKRYQSIVDFAEIGDFIDQPVKTYSSGMYVRLAFAIIAHVDADTLVIDEALSVGDVRFTQKCMRFLRDFQSHGTLLFVSHDPGAVVNLCRRAIWLDAGTMIVDGPARDVVERYLAEQHAADRASVNQRVTVHAAKKNVRNHKPSGISLMKDMPFDVVDSRQAILNGRGQRNLIEMFAFDSSRIDSEFGAGAARVVDVRLQSAAGDATTYVEGGEPVDLVIEVQAVSRLHSPIVGFYVKDRLGQQLFGDNTYISYFERHFDAVAGTRIRAHFQFRMPNLAVGSYSIDAAVATGTQDDHTQQHWVRDALVFKVNSSSVVSGLVGIPMYRIELEHVET